jgi:hypothetical protein
MPTKASILERIGDDGLLLPQLVMRALAANDRLKYYLTLLQAACAYATAPRSPAPSLRVEREASGITDSSLDHIIEGSSTIGVDRLHVPHAGSIIEQLFDELRVMLHPLSVAQRTHPEVRPRVDVYKRRLDALVAHAPMCHDDQLMTRAVAVLTGRRGNGHDTAYQLAMDLHGELNRLLASVAEDTIEGARVYDITPADRPLVLAFMTGINETAHLKFDHPGLGTTATRDGSRLSIQNDLGSTDAHVVVVHVSGLLAELTYTDVHPRRIAFLQDLLRPYGVQWSAAPFPPARDFEMNIGSYTAETPEHLERYLTYLGSRLVFLIDWNRARKRLSRLVRKSAAVDLLKWAADNNVGHRAFLQVGDIALIDAALERTAPGHMQIGARLDEWMGEDAARVFLMSVLRLTASGLAAGRSVSLIEDEVEAELLRRIQTSDPHLLHGAAEHAAIIAALAERVRHVLTYERLDEPPEQLPPAAELARPWSAQADRLVVHACRRLSRAADRELCRLLTEADVAADALEEAAFMVTLLPESVDRLTLSLLANLSDVVAEGVRDYMRCLEEGRDLSSASAYADTDQFLVVVDRLLDVNRQASAKKRALTEQLVRGPGDFHDLHVVGDIARELERAAAALARCGGIVRDHVLGAPGR